MREDSERELLEEVPVERGSESMETGKQNVLILRRSV